MEVDEKLLRIILTHLGFIKAYEERSKPLINSLITHHVIDDILERSTLIVEMLKIEEYFVSTFLQDTNYSIQNDRAKHLLSHLLLTMKSSLEDKKKSFREILTNFKLRFMEQNNLELISQIGNIEAKIPENLH